LLFFLPPKPPMYIWKKTVLYYTERGGVSRQTPLERQEEGQAHWDVVSTLIHLPRIMFNNACEKCRTTKTINDFGATRCVVTFYSVGGFSIQLSNYNDITSDL
jgi:hypothetical protein